MTHHLLIQRGDEKQILQQQPGMLQAQLRPSVKLQTGCKSSFFGGGITRQLQRLTISTSRARAPLEVSASGRVCQLTGKKANNGYNVTFSHIRNKKKQQVNLQRRRVYWPEGKRWVKLRLSTTAIKTLETKGLQTMAKEIGLDLNSLPYNDVSKNRLEWLKENSKGYPAANKKTVGKSRRMKNPEKLAASKKKPLVPRYLAGGSVILTRDPRYVEEYRE